MADLKFHDHIISDLVDPSSAGGGLVVISAGLSLGKLVTSLLLRHSPSHGTVLILTPPSQTLRSQIRFQSLSLPEISAEVPATHRVSLYSSGTAVFVTARILIVDILTSRLPAAAIAGIVLLSAHSLAETSTEAFIVRVLRSLNRNVFVRAFSDRAGAMVGGFAKAERTMKCLGIRKLHLWPRFHVYISEELEAEPPEVVDVRVRMSKYMVAIQAAIIEVMDGCLKEMRKTNKVDVEDLTVENGLFKSFDEIVRRQLDPIWHTLGRKTKQLVSDLKTLRKLLDYLVRYDAVTYLKYLDTLRVSESHRSVWIFAESSYKIFEYAKKRVYCFVKADGTKFCTPSKTATSKKRKLKSTTEDGEDKVGGASSTNSNVSIFLEDVLEEAPKWKVLRELLEEIEEERQSQGLLEDDSGIVLVACKDERSCMQLDDCLNNGPKQVMKEEWEKYLLNKVQLRDLQSRYKKKPKEPKGFGVLDGVTPVTPVKNGEPSSTNKLEQDALVAAASEIRKRITKDGPVEVDPQPKVSDEGAGSKARNTRNKKNVAATRRRLRNKDDKNGKETALDESNSEDNVQTGKADHQDKGVLRTHSEPAGASGSENSNKPIPPVQFHALESGQPVLETLKPTVIIAYHPDVTFVREIEVHKAENPSRKLKVYFLFYDDSTEVQKFEASIRRENGAFESLIRQKSSMMIPLDQDLQNIGMESSFEGEGTVSQNSMTRKAGGRRDAMVAKQVIVDMREFMSSLPNVLHQKGMKIIPVTLEVGDYILSPSICVERKSIQDLFMSFTSGRLYHQAEMMVRYYKIPVLLIEFSQDKSFSFQSASDIGDDVTLNNIISKLSLLALHFPRLRIIWSRSLHATAEIFDSLKSNQDEPDEAKATRVGVPSEDGIIDSDVRAENYNTSAVEFLRRLPGVTDSNYRAIMDNCKSLAELSLLPLERLAELMGGQKSARTLREFLDAKYPTLL